MFSLIFSKNRKLLAQLKKLEYENASLNKIINLMPSHVYWKDLQFKYLGCNQMQADSLGFDTPEGLLGKLILN